MELKIHDPACPGEAIVFSTDRKEHAEKMIACLIAEIKQNEQFEESQVNGGNWLAAAMKLVDEVRGSSPFRGKVKLRDYEAGQAIQTADAATQKAAIFLCSNYLSKSRHSDLVTDRVCEAVLAALLRKKLVYSDAEVVKLLVPLASKAFIFNNLPVGSILTHVERHIEKFGLNKSVCQQLERMSKQYHSLATYGDARKAGARVEALLARPVATSNQKPKDNSAVEEKSIDEKSDEVDFELSTGEAWTNALLTELERLSSESKLHWYQLLKHCSSARSSKPTKKFLNRSQELLELIGDKEFTQVIRPVLSAVGQPGKCQRLTHYGQVSYGEATQIHEKHVDRLRGLVWTTSLVENEALVGDVGDTAEKCFQKIREVGPRSPKIGNACLIALSTLASESAVAQLGRLKSRAGHVSTRKQIAKAFTVAANNAGMTEADLVELGVPNFGMTEVGGIHETFGELTAMATLYANRKSKLVWHRADGKTQKTVPAKVKDTHSDQLKCLKNRLKEIDKLMPSVRQRVEHLFVNERRWSLADFRKRFLDHPVVGVIARRLIWNIDLNGTTTAAFWHDGQFVTSNGKSASTEKASSVSIWHPMQGSAEDVFRWRGWLEANEITQPFKQAHREVYILTDAERTTVDHSNRFASHIIRQHQFAALCQLRGWRFVLQGDWDSWNAPYLDMPQYGLRAEFLVDPMEGQNDVTQAFVYTNLATEHVQFFRIEDAVCDRMTPVPLEEIPPIVFSEVMRDIDLFVGVTSIGNDPEWQERGADEPYADYWEKFSFGDLSQTAVTRKQTLESIMPRLAIAEQCHFDGNFLVVRGNLRTYKIHLGSGNILMTPDDQYLCIVQKRGNGNKRTDNLYLPFEGDNTLSLILSKAFLLAEDDKIKDPTITNQLRLDRD